MFCMYNIKMEQRPTMLFYVAVLLSQSQRVAWLSVKEFEDLNFFCPSQGQTGLLL
jgi:hypothetical protein